MKESESQVILSIRDLSVSLPEGERKRDLVRNLSFSLRSGEALGIVGESGSGKTLTALAILQLLPPGMKITQGSVLVRRGNSKIPGTDEPGGKAGTTQTAGSREPAPGSSGAEDLAGLNEKQMRAYRGRVVSMIFQEPMTSLNPSMRCGEQVLEAVRLHQECSARDAREKVLSLFREVDLPADRGFVGKYPHRLSGGQRQRVMIAMALAGNPEILIADEPTTALDVTVQKKILDLLLKIRKQRMMSMIFISHDLGVIRMVCRRALVMYRGEIVESGNVEELFGHPRHPYTRGLIACRPVSPDPTKPWRDKPARLPTLADFTDRKSATPGKTVVHDTVRSGSQAQPLLEVRNLRVEYTLRRSVFGVPVKKLAAVDDLNFCIHPGETLGLIGESGCGKSTLGRSIIRLIRSGQGLILYRGKDVSSLRGRDMNAYRQKVQFIFQDPFSSLNPTLAVGPAIQEVMRVHGMHGDAGERKRATVGLLKRVGLGEEHYRRYPHEFSGGQRQRIGLARSLATGPELIICDESVSSLDVSVQARILNLLNDLKESLGLTYFFISHDLSVVRYMSDRILVMKDGRLVEEASGDELFTRPASPYTRELIDSIPR